MSLFNLPVEHVQKTESVHPWAKTIKQQFATKILGAHNSVKNVVYYPFPKTRKRRGLADKITITIVGNRVTKEFIYCVKLVQGMHKYRWDIFDAPIIRGVTGVEWPNILSDLKIRYGSAVNCLLAPVAVFYNDQFIGGDQELKELIETKYSYHVSINYYNEAVRNFHEFVKSSQRACVYMHISIDEKHIGTLIFMLYSEIVPKTCENFLRLCQTTRGGYSGTPVHRIVKDGWIQCGGFGLKSTEMDCENFIVPHDRRGVLGMCNATRHVDCSTQFFVLLQPMEWMMHKYVGFGQLIDGEETLKKIEEVPTYYESPTADITIYDAGVLNLDCHNIIIHRGVPEYIDGHIDDLNIIAKIFSEMLFERVWMEIEFNALIAMEMRGEGSEEDIEGDEVKKDIRETQRFLRKKEDFQNQYFQNQEKLRTSLSSRKSHEKQKRHELEEENNEYGVDDYYYEPEEYSYPQQLIADDVEPRPFYIELTDVPYPGEVDSTFDLKRFLQGDYCLEADLDRKQPKLKRKQSGKTSSIEKKLLVSEIMNSYCVTQLKDETDSNESSVQLDSDEEREIKAFLETNGEKASFSGAVVRGIAKHYVKKNPIEEKTGQEIFTDEEVRRIRMATADYKDRFNKKVSISVEPWRMQNQIIRKQTGPLSTPSEFLDMEEMDEEKRALILGPNRKVSISVPEGHVARKIKRRQTGFVHPDDLAVISGVLSTNALEDDEEDYREDKMKVRIAPKEANELHEAKPRSSGSLFKAGGVDDRKTRPSVLVRLYEDVALSSDEELPTLKDYRPKEEKNRLTMSLEGFKGNLLKRSENVFLHSAEEPSVSTLPMRKKIDRDSLDRGTADVETKEWSLRSKGFGANRPSISVAEYKRRNQQRIQDMKTVARVKTGGETKVTEPVVETKEQVQELESGKEEILKEKSGKSEEVIVEEIEKNEDVTVHESRKNLKHVKSKSQSADVDKKSHGLRLPGDTPLYGSAASVGEPAGTK